MKNQNITEDRLYRFFFTNLNTGLQNYEINNLGVSDHVSKLLVKFTNQKFLRSLKKKVVSNYENRKLVSADYNDIIKDLKHLYIEDLERSLLPGSTNYNAGYDFYAHKLIGDYALFMVGMFSDFLENRRYAGFSKNYYVSKGQTHYSIASYHYESITSNYNDNIFELMSERFLLIAETIDSMNQSNWDIERVRADALMAKYAKLLGN